MPLISTLPFPESNPLTLKKEELNSKAAVLRKISMDDCSNPEILSAELASLFNSSSVIVIKLKSWSSEIFLKSEILPKSNVFLIILSEYFGFRNPITLFLKDILHSENP